MSRYLRESRVLALVPGVVGGLPAHQNTLNIYTHPTFYIIFL
jgi:hypothetical protein